MKIVINNCFGGFSVSLEAAKWMAERGHERAKKELEEFKRPPTKDELEIKSWYGSGYVDDMDGGYERNDPLLVAVVEALGDKANGEYSSLKVIEIPDDVKWFVYEDDGLESIHEEHRSWR